MNKKTQIAIQLAMWILGMIINYYLTGHVLVGGLTGVIAGLILGILNKK